MFILFFMFILHRANNITKARTQEVGTTESVRDLSGDGLSSKDKEHITNYLKHSYKIYK